MMPSASTQNVVGRNEKTTHRQESAYHSPHTASRLVQLVAWRFVWAMLCVWTPKPLNPWRLFWLRAFGATIIGTPFVHQSARIHMPWNLVMYDRACLGEGAVAYSQGVIEIGERATVAQEAYLCTGSHDFSDPTLPLVTAPIRIGADAFIGARAFILPGVTIGEGGVIGAASVVSRDTPPQMICAGNPCRTLQSRQSK